MKERPIIFNAEMVRAILDGSKTQTRRLVKFPIKDINIGCELSGNELAAEIATGDYSNSKVGMPGDRLWVRETFAVGLCTKSTMAYRATHKPIDLDEGWDEVIKWRPSIHMPRWASRIQLEITNARVERLNAISEDDAMAEGMDDGTSAAAIAVGWFERPQRAFQRLWEQIYGEDSWASNPWVWVIEFKRVEGGAA